MVENCLHLDMGDCMWLLVQLCSETQPCLNLEVDKLNFRYDELV